jgi:hypothetical protein
MENTIFLREAVNTNRTLFDQAYNAGVALQNETERAVNVLLDNVGWINEGARSNINHLNETYRHERDRVKTFIDDGFDNLEELLEPARRKRAAGKK